MKLSKFALNSQVWADEAYPYNHTIAEAMFPEHTFAIVSVDPEHTTDEELASALPEGWQLDFATGGKKNGSFIMTRGGPLVSESFWTTAEEAVGYGSVLLTPCSGTHPMTLDLNVLVVEDGEYSTGDCHGKAGLKLWAKLGQSIDLAAQFRLGVRDEGVLAKGTLVIDGSVEGDELDNQGIDLVLPRSAFKCSAKPETGMHTWTNAVLGVAAWSKPRRTKFSWQVLQWFSWEAIEHDLGGRVEVIAAQLLGAMTDTRSLVSLLKLDAKEMDLPFVHLVESDKSGLLSQHPYVVRTALRMLRQRWLDLALTGAGEFTGLMGLPDDNLPLGVVATNDLPAGEYVATRYPLRYWGDLRVWKNVGGSHIHEGVVYMSHATAALLAGDFDGDFFQMAPAEDYPTMAKEIRDWGSRPQVEILKVKERKASALTQEELARVMLENANSQVGLIATMIARANIAGEFSLVPPLAQELQISVDKFKYNLDHDYEFLEEANKSLPGITWLKGYKSQDAYQRRTMQVADHEGVIGQLIQKVNAFWKPLDVLARPLVEYAKLLPEPTAHVKEARVLNQRYGKLVSEAMKVEDEDERKDAFSRIFESLESWTNGLEDPAEWASAIWRVTHACNSKGTASLAFHALPAEIAERARHAKVDKVSIVGLRFNAYANTLAQFDGSDRTVNFALRPLKGHLRMAALLDGAVLGFVSSETPVQQGIRRMSLTHSQAGKAAVVYAA